MNDDRKLILVDAYGLIFRAYYAFMRNPMYNREGFNTSCVFGFVNALEDVLNSEKPSHVAVAFDPSGPNFRHELYPEYKANRNETPEDIKKSVPYIKNILRAYGIPILQVDGFEADDIIGTIAKKAERDGYNVYMMTADKDFIQLLSERIFMYKPGRSGSGIEIVTMEKACADFKLVHPVQFIDILGLMGDTADNIPGAPGVGEKTAVKLISEYHSIEQVFENLAKLKGKLRENLMNFKDQILLSRKLATIETNVPLQISEEELRISKPDLEEVKKIFGELNFKTLEKRVLSRYSVGNTKETLKSAPVQGSLFDAPPPVQSVPGVQLHTISDTIHHYELVDNDSSRKNLISKLLELNEFCFDTETTSLEVTQAELVGMSFAWKKGEAWYIPFSSDKVETLQIVDELRSILENENITKVGQNIKFDILVLKNYGVEVKGKLFDTMLAHYLLQPEQRHNMNYLAERYLHYEPVHIEELIGEKGSMQNNMRNVEISKIKEYAAEDADVTWQLYEILKKDLENAKLLDLAAGVEMPLVHVLAAMEYNGVTIDKASLNEIAIELRKDILILERRIHDLAGMEFNISSPRQLGEILFEKLKIEGNHKKTKSKQYATNEEVLAQLTGKHEIVPLILEYRGLRKLLNTYVEALPRLIRPKTGRIHTTFSQAIASTGRLSSIDPNLQNIPIREERGREIRKSFIPSSSENFILSADYSQIELRIMAHMCQDPNLMEAFLKNEDIHTSTASKIFNVAESDISREMRSKAKTANFGIIYGISAFGLSQRLNIPRKEASDLIDGYFASFPGVRRYMDQCIQSARLYGFVETIMGRKRYLPDINSSNANVRGFAERNAINSPIQGSAADIIKLAMIHIHKRFLDQKCASKMIIQVHDELVFDVNASELNWVKETVKFEMEHALSLSVPLLVDIGYGNNWLDAH